MNFKPNIKNIATSYRFTEWWGHIVPPIFGLFYLSCYLSNNHFPVFAISALLFLPIVFSQAAFGYLLNNYFDRFQDNIAGKPNKLNTFPTAVIFLLLAFPLVIAIACLLILAPEQIVWYVYFAHTFLLILYSIPIIRLKERPIIGVLSDSIYSSVLFSFIALTILPYSLDQVLLNSKVVLFLLLTLLFKGIRNILLHQIKDYANDKLANVKTFATAYGESFSKKIAGLIIFPIELILGSAALIFLSKVDSIFLYILPFLIIYCVCNYLSILSKFKRSDIFEFANNLYEDFFPLFMLSLLSLHNLNFLWILAIHVIIFKSRFCYYFLYYKFLNHFLYHKCLLWFYYKAFRNEYIRKFYSMIGLKNWS
jgi:4-hydroxybenzoate polyprenyltransferase